MPNIALLNYCNLSCPYCFANEFIEENKQIITLEQLNKILNFIQKSFINNKKERIGLIGGEPTLHPQFKEILLTCCTFCEENNLQQPLIFTNGIELAPYIKFLDKSKALINLNEPDIVGTIKWNKIENNLNTLNELNLLQKKITIGINIYPDIQNFSYIFEIAKKYNLSSIRSSIVAPTCHYLHQNKDDYYNLMKEIFLKFIQQGIKDNIKIHLDCNKIPLCYFTKEEKQIVLQACDNFTNYCQPVVDITPDFKATSCFGTYNLIDLNEFDNLEEVHRYFLFHDIYDKTIKNGTGKCKDCKKFNNFSCQGGCLAFAK